MRIFALSSLLLALALPACTVEEKTTETSATAATEATGGGTTAAASTGGTTAENPTGGTTGEAPTTGMTGTSATGSTGEPGTSGSTGGTTGEPGSTGGTTGGVGGPSYGPCEMANPPCPADSDCVMIQGIEGNFCSPKCGMADCPMFDGAAQPMCVLQLEMGMSATNCALICNPMAMGECPEGSTCKQVPMQQVGICTYP